MTIGGGIALIVVGAILAFAVQIEPQAIDLTMIGYILMIAGVVGIVVGVAMWSTRRTRAIRREPGGRVVEERVEDRQI